MQARGRNDARKILLSIGSFYRLTKASLAVTVKAYRYDLGAKQSVLW